MAAGGSAWIVDKGEVAQLFDAADGQRDVPPGVLDRIGPLGPVFKAFIERNRQVVPLPEKELRALFDSCAREPDPARVLTSLRQLSPGDGQVGYRQVNLLTDHYTQRVDAFLSTHGASYEQVGDHDSAFGSGGDFYKTRHATTEACILASTELRICKTGTRNVTSEHGSVDAIRAHRYQMHTLGSDGADFLAPVRTGLDATNFAFISLAQLGLPYSDAMLVARRDLWRAWMRDLALDPDNPSECWHHALARVDMPIDIFKVVGANAQPLRPLHHSTGVCHQALLPYVLGIYLDRDTTGMIVHGYDGIDEFSVGSSDLDATSPTSLVIHVRSDTIVIAQLGPEDLGLDRAPLSAILQNPDSAEEARTFRRILADRDHSAHRDLVVANAALLLVAGEAVPYAGAAVGAAMRVATDRIIDLIGSGKALSKYRAVFPAAAPDLPPSTSAEAIYPTGPGQHTGHQSPADLGRPTTIPPDPRRSAGLEAHR